MAKLFINSNNFIVIKMTFFELRVSCDTHQMSTYIDSYNNSYNLICDNCEKCLQNNEVYYIPGISKHLCPNCFNKWNNSNNIKTKENKELEKYNYWKCVRLFDIGNIKIIHDIPNLTNIKI